MLPRLFIGDRSAHALDDGFTDPIGVLIGKRGDASLSIRSRCGPRPNVNGLIEQGNRPTPHSVLADEAPIPSTGTIPFKYARIDAARPTPRRIADLPGD